jgi:hypothetical protein
MGWLAEFRRRLAFLLRRNQFESDLEEEMHFHLERKTADLDPLADRRQFGNAALVRDESRDAWGWGPFERAWREVRSLFASSARTRRSPPLGSQRSPSASARIR